MPSSRFLISSQTLGSAAASVTFSSIPATYTDLVVRGSARADQGNQFREIYLTLNNLTTSIYSYTRLYGTGTTRVSARETANTPSNTATIFVNDSASTANTFGSFEIYLPSYTVAQKKPISLFSAQEDNATSAYMQIVAELVDTTAAINEIKLTCTNFVSGSSFYLYGIKNS